jgi:hypothetical protein
MPPGPNHLSRRQETDAAARADAWAAASVVFGLCRIRMTAPDQDAGRTRVRIRCIHPNLLSQASARGGYAARCAPVAIARPHLLRWLRCVCGDPYVDTGVSVRRDPPPAMACRRHAREHAGDLSGQDERRRSAGGRDPVPADPVHSRGPEGPPEGMLGHATVEQLAPVDDATLIRHPLRDVHPSTVRRERHPLAVSAERVDACPAWCPWGGSARSIGIGSAHSIRVNGAYRSESDACARIR